MRQIGTLAGETEARRFADYLASQDIQARVDADPPQWAIWILDEDRVDAAREALELFRQNPGDARFQRVEQSVEQRRRQQTQQAAAQKSKPAPRRVRPSPWGGGRPLTLLLIAASVFVTVWPALADNEAAVRQLLSIAPYGREGTFIHWQGLLNIRQGEIWRLVTPIFLHASLTEGMGILHLLFNMLWLNDLGGQVERRRGTWRYGLLVLLLAVVSNLAQYYWHGPSFGGMSGVVYGLLGYVWIKMRYEPRLGLYLQPGIMLLMTVFFLLGFSRMLGPVANLAHAAGLGMGLLWAGAPVALRRIWRPRRNR